MFLRTVTFLVLVAGMAVSATASPDDKAHKHHAAVHKKPHTPKVHRDTPKHDHPASPRADHHAAPAPTSDHHDWGTYPH